MNPFQTPVHCVICGGIGMAHSGYYRGEGWLGDSYVHQDPRTCQDYLFRQARRVAEMMMEQAGWVDGLFRLFTPA